MKLRVQIIMVYEANPESYGTDDPQKMAEIDQRNFEDDPGSLYGLMDSAEYKVVVDAPFDGFVKS